MVSPVFFAFRRQSSPHLPDFLIRVLDISWTILESFISWNGGCWLDLFCFLFFLLFKSFLPKQAYNHWFLSLIPSWMLCGKANMIIFEEIEPLSFFFRNIIYNSFGLSLFENLLNSFRLNLNIWFRRIIDTLRDRSFNNVFHFFLSFLDKHSHFGAFGLTSHIFWFKDTLFFGNHLFWLFLRRRRLNFNWSVIFQHDLFFFNWDGIPLS